jgi:hypothetical protein
MKKIKTLVLAVVMITTLFSCTDNKSVEEQAVAPSKSNSLRMHLSNIKKVHNIHGKDGTDTLTFVFPLTLSYTNGTVITVASMDALLAILTNETETVYVNGIAFPFQVVSTGGGTTEVSNESGYETVIENNNIDTVNDIVSNSTCFDFIYPLTVIGQNNQQITVNTEVELLALANSDNEINFAYPLTVLSTNNQMTIIVTVDSLYEFLALNICY